MPTILELAETASVAAIGPGMGLSAKIPEVIEILLVQLDLPVVLDADGINALTILRNDALARRPAPTILTPHPGEFARLLKCSTEDVQANRDELAFRFAADHKVIIVLKGHGTLVTDGERMYRNTTGNPGMSTGGSGDVLTGLIAALIAQGMSVFDAAHLGVHIHGKAGDLAADARGQVGMIASDLIDFLPLAIRS